MLFISQFIINWRLDYDYHLYKKKLHDTFIIENIDSKCYYKCSFEKIRC